MATNEEIMTKNKEKIMALINGGDGNATIGGTTIYKLANVDGRSFYYTHGDICVWGDTVEIAGSIVALRQGGYVIALLTLTEE